MVPGVQADGWAEAGLDVGSEALAKPGASRRATHRAEVWKGLMVGLRD